MILIDMARDIFPWPQSYDQVHFLTFSSKQNHSWPNVPFSFFSFCVFFLAVLMLLPGGASFGNHFATNKEVPSLVSGIT